jgi:hypothetical protein
MLLPSRSTLQRRPSSDHTPMRSGDHQAVRSPGKRNARTREEERTYLRGIPGAACGLTRAIRCAFGLDITVLRFARRPEWTPVGESKPIARRRVKVCVVRTTGPRRIDLRRAGHDARMGRQRGTRSITSAIAAFVGRAQARRYNARDSAHNRMRASETYCLLHFVPPFRRA